MFGIMDIFTPSFFILLAILFLLIALLVVYIETKWREQNHKISSMLSLVSSLAEEMNVLRFNLHQTTNVNSDSESLYNKNITMTYQSQNNHLIPVSDDDEDDEEDQDNKDDDDEQNGDDDDDDDDDDQDDDVDNDDDDNKTTIFKLNISHEFREEDEDNLEPEVIEIGEINDIKVLKLESHENENVEYDEENDLAELDAHSVSDLETLDSTSQQNKSNVKSIDLKSISFEENKTDEQENIDYKKLSIPRLRTIVAEKKLILDSSKLKKNELLKLLGIE